MKTGHGRSYLMVAASSAIGVVATLVSGILLARLLSVEDRGIVALVIYWAGFAAAFGNLSLPDAFVYRNRAAGANVRDLLPAMLAVVLLVTVVAIALAIVSIYGFAERFEGVSLTLVAFSVAAFVLINYVNRALIAAERASLSFGRLAIERVLLPLVYSGLLILAALIGWMDVQTVLAIFLVSRTPLLAVRLWRYRGALVGRFAPRDAAALLSTGARYHGVELLKILADQADKIIVSLQWTAASIAHFAVAYSAVGAGYSLVSQALNVVSLPVASKLSSEEVIEHLPRSLRITTILLVAVMIPLALIAPFLVPLLFGPNYVESVLATQILALALLPSPLIAQTDAVLRARGQVFTALRLHLLTIIGIAIGWLATGYPEIVSLGLALAASRMLALVLTLASVGGEFRTMRLLDCLVWRGEDFRAISETARGVFGRLARKG